MGFIVTPRLCGCAEMPRPARFAKADIFVVQVPYLAIVAEHTSGTRRISPDGSFSSAIPPSFETNCAAAPPNGPSATLARPQFDVMHHCAGGILSSGRRISNQNVAVGPS